MRGPDMRLETQEESKTLSCIETGRLQGRNEPNLIRDQCDDGKNDKLEFIYSNNVKKFFGTDFCLSVISLLGFVFHHRYFSCKYLINILEQ